jgi:hypothetical protein
MANPQSHPSVFIGTTEVAGYFVNLFLGFKKAGVDAGYLNLDLIKFNYQGHQHHNYVMLNALQNYSQYTSQLVGIKRVVLRPLYALFKVLTFIWVLFKFDVFIFGTGSSFFRHYDFRILKFFNKKIVHVSLGSDSRPQYISGIFKDDSKGQVNLEKMIENNQRIIKLIAAIEKYATVIVNYPQHAHFHKRDFVSGMFIGFPTRIEDDIKEQRSNPVTRILHAPTRPLMKGSIQFRDIIRELQSEGLNINFVEITNKTNLEVIEEIKRSDIILDELYSDLPLGGLGAEAAMYAKPVVLGGYYAAHLSQYASSEIPPSHYVLPQEVKATLRRLIVDEHYRMESGRNLNRFINEQWRNDIVAGKYLQIIANNYPQHWNISVSNLSYLNGIGLSEAELRQIITRIVTEYGADCLFLNHNPQLLKKYLDLTTQKHA